MNGPTIKHDVEGCGDVIVSTYRHDFVTCKCGKLSTDGGDSYLRLVGDLKNAKRLDGDTWASVEDTP